MLWAEAQADRPGAAGDADSVKNALALLDRAERVGRAGDHRGVMATVHRLRAEYLGRLGALMAVDGEGVLRGVVTVEQVRRALQSALGSPASAGR